VEHISFVDLEETDLDDNPKEINEKQHPDGCFFVEESLLK